MLSPSNGSKCIGNSNTTLVKVKFLSFKHDFSFKCIQIQHLLKLNLVLPIWYITLNKIQIQLLLKLNIYKPARDLETDEFKYNSC